MRPFLRVAIASTATLLLASPALAAETAPGLGDEGQFILSAERLFGVNHTTFKQDGDSLTAFRVTFFSSGGPEVGQTVPNPTAIPRLAGDWVVAPNLTIGAGVGVAYANYKDDNSDGVTSFGILAAPRIGYIVPVGSTARFWLRGGVSYFRSNQAYEGSTRNRTWNHFSATIEPTFALPLGGNAMFTIAPVADIPLSGKYTSGTSSEKLTALSFGANCGLLAYF